MPRRLVLLDPPPPVPAELIDLSAASSPLTAAHNLLALFMAEAQSDDDAPRLESGVSELQALPVLCQLRDSISHC